VLYFAGCYAGYLRPAIGRATVDLLRRAGMTVVTPPQHCCGLPMLSRGMAGSARGRVRQNLKQWQALLDRVDHVVVSCSSCGLALMEHWPQLLADPAVDRVRHLVMHVSRLLGPRLDRLTLDGRPLHAAYHMPCHLQVQPAADSSIALLQAVDGLTLSALDSHCCGMAGTWGFAAANIGLSLEIGQDLARRLMASGARMAVTDCPTCQIQLEQLTGRIAYHPVEVLHRRLRADARAA
jgi:Fe-S oxidoreductase